MHDFCLTIQFSLNRRSTIKSSNGMANWRKWNNNIHLILYITSTFLETYRYQSTIYQDLTERLENGCYKGRNLILMSGDR